MYIMYINYYYYILRRDGLLFPVTGFRRWLCAFLTRDGKHGRGRTPASDEKQDGPVPVKQKTSRGKQAEHSRTRVKAVDLPVNELQAHGGLSTILGKQTKIRPLESKIDAYAGGKQKISRLK